MQAKKAKTLPLKKQPGKSGKTCTQIYAHFSWWNWNILFTAHASNCYFTALQTVLVFPLMHLHIDSFALMSSQSCISPKSHFAHQDLLSCADTQLCTLRCWHLSDPLMILLAKCHGKRLNTHLIEPGDENRCSGFDPSIWQLSSYPSKSLY